MAYQDEPMGKVQDKYMIQLWQNLCLHAYVQQSPPWMTHSIYLFLWENISIQQLNWIELKSTLLLYTVSL